ncbi:type I-E CRISPR-associated protein Cas5/CasD [Glutamicibacter sp. PS]|uniref:type I-E CRISPR-associated protein Cas5/CasD n=1 Tax=Glutamicibacter sp. PS TaxID=3075634 RepID=UPI00283C2624|nr:type I-E CRISPR-associated protein Cas5/CasD [Glutamicibacter sp. PS]MDR4534008.1 type I-E CRISPR-associated protein Cas5/CasD [Glutamicibacter sp. PS]
MNTLLLRLKGPMQAWGVDSRYTTRSTQEYPSKSGVLGLLAAAQGRRRTDPLEDLAGLSFGVRTDQPGVLMRDFRTAQNWETGKSQPLSSRYYLADAIFVAGISGPERSLAPFREALARPRFPLYLGRRSCPVNPDLFIDIVDQELEIALRSVPWQASLHHRQSRSQKVHLPIYRDANQDETGDQVQDVPLSFDSAHRQYGWRTVYTVLQEVDNPDSTARSDPFFEAVISS